MPPLPPPHRRFARFRLMARSALAACIAVPVSAQPAPQQPPAPDEQVTVPVTTEDEAHSGDIIVTAAGGYGSALTDIPADEVLNAEAIASYGASNAADLVAALAVQTRSGRGRGSGMPVVLVNGRRVSGFGEIRNLPPEAIRRVDIFPEEVALSYGYAADQRVVNIVLVDQFSAMIVESEWGGSTQGGYATRDLEGNFLQIAGPARINLTANYETNSRITEAERDIEPTGAVDDTALRTLRPASRQLRLEATGSLPVTQRIGTTINLSTNIGNSRSWSGLAPQLPYALAAAPSPLISETDSRTDHIGSTSDGRIGRWRWTLTGNYDRGVTSVRSERRSGDAAAPLTIDRSRSLSNTAEADLVLAGRLFHLPAGPVQTTLQGGWKDISFESLAMRGGISTTTDLSRTAYSASANVDLPIASRSGDVLGWIGDLSVNGRYALRDVSDFRLLTSWTAGISWSPVERLDLLATWVRDETAPAVSQLGTPLLVTPNVATYDFTTGQSVLVTTITGGNPALLAERQRDWRLAANWRPMRDGDLSLNLSYARVRSSNTTAALPLLTPVIEAAFAERVTRDGNGDLVSIDLRPVNFAETRGQQIRYGVSFSRSFGQAGGPGGPGRGGAMAGPGAGGRGPGGGAGRGPGFGGPMFGGGNGGRWNIALFHTVKLQDEILIRPGVPVLDLLNGDATGASGGSTRHTAEMDAGWFYRGIGLRLNGSWQSGSNVAGQPLAGGGTSSALRFSPLTTLNLRAFVNFDQQRSLIEAVPFLRGSRVRIGIDNLLNDIRTVRDVNGDVPLRYQPGYLDPIGRSFEIEFRKLF